MLSHYIQSGNVLFKAAEKDKAKLTTKIENVLSERFSYKSRLVTVTYKELKKVVEEAPKGFGKDLDKYRCDVIFLKEPLTVKEAMKNVRVKEGVDNAYAGKTVLYFSRLTSRASQSYLTKIITLPMYQNMTIRNWNTTTKLLALMEAGNEDPSPKKASKSKTKGVARQTELSAKQFVEQLKTYLSATELKKYHRYFKFDESDKE